MALFLFLLLVALVLGILGVTLKGMLYLLFIGIAVFLLSLVLLGATLGRRRGRRPAR
ncbi:hypothetical protein ACFW9F_08190 [Streptomyces sp. NPDC059506]|uniref:hypothetical protein n=1 Tax=Streptomyces sp. NPDC059506 TaxID=3347751 RepID=UPI0036A393E8